MTDDSDWAATVEKVRADPRLARCTDPVVRAVDIAHVRFSRTDVKRQADFLADFGLHETGRAQGWTAFSAVGGYGPCYLLSEGDDAFRGLALAVGSRSDLERLAALPDASAIEPALCWPEGEQVKLTDPAGNRVHAVHGPLAPAAAPRESLSHNIDGELRRLNAMQRPPAQPATILRLGHAVLGVVDFFRCVRWYMDHFGLIPSDVQTIGEGDPALMFMRCDRGDTPTDHHTLVIAQNVVNGFSHCAFECIDVDDIAMGQEWLHSRGWKHAWGMGRHLLGSQIFNYWRDPVGAKHEHFIDSDKFTAARPPDVSPLSSGGLYQWGPPVPADFEKPKMSPRLLWRAFRNVRASEEMSFARARALMRAMKDPPRPWH
ncbi:VOC family protein [Sphingosinithalassobacter portus]|uniref:VOC family protein n=1 Tax=Stakelama portus TaxID=2676234 RepID=UPI000D6E9735|nr:VOC family protein [Sphingosinithalassobacter portus]